ncbi:MULTISPECIES: hypothetical protein [Methanobacterium]|uniref:Uncharacterized protein n=1 Tax=Methanobacterium veterum TaxID=408577 RepID=A0A9E4ZWC2_9EURY|nr:MULTISPECIES: hypothetical protein [Methanobacterium]MCZ3366772.1 hypothetical protein [Methanobacterium veterum]MCZ3374082.1 hypothetical protein [Methanobacterium veterum]
MITLKYLNSQQIIVIVVILSAVVALKFTAPITSLILLSIFLSLLIYLFLKWLEKRGLSYNIGMVITLLGIFIWVLEY